MVQNSSVLVIFPGMFINTSLEYPTLRVIKIRPNNTVIVLVRGSVG